MQPSPIVPQTPPQQGLGWPQRHPEEADETQRAMPAGSIGPQQRASLAKGLVRPAGPAQMCD